MPPVIVPPTISTIPSESIVALRPAFDIAVSKSPTLDVELKVIVVYSPFESLTTTVSPLLTVIPFPNSESSVSVVATVDTVIIVS